MQKLSKVLITIMASAFVALVGVFIGSIPDKTNNIPLQEEVVATTSTSLTSKNSKIFKEERGEGLASFLEITIPEGPSSVKSIKIIQTIGSTSAVLTEDETGKLCYYQNSALSTKNTTFYFTRPATYTVVYIYGQNNTRVQESCNFKPELNIDTIKKMSTTLGSGTTTTKTTIVEADNKFFLTGNGEITIPTDSKGLYTISATTGSTPNPDLLTEIPDNTFGTITYTIKSTNGNCYLTLDIIVLTVDFSIEFTNLNDIEITKSNYEYLNGYVFNEGVKAVIAIDETAKNLKGNTLNNTEKLTALNHLNFELVEVQRDATNTNNKEPLTSAINKPTTTPVLEIDLEEKDHSIYSIKTTIANSTNDIELKNNLPKVKVITKVPVNSDGKTVFSIIPTQGDNKEESNYISGILNNYINKDTIIYYPREGIRVFYNQDAFGSNNISYKFNSSVGTISSSMDFLRLNSPGGVSNLQISSKTLDFDQFYTFSFITKSYTVENTQFHSSMLSGQMQYAVNLAQNHFYNVTDDYSDSFNSISTPITAFKYTFPNNYESTCIPMYIRITYNGTHYNSINKGENGEIVPFENGDQLLFTARGDYSVEFYNLPNYDYIENNIPNWNSNGATASVNFYYKLDFKITGPSIKVTTANANGEPLTISNNMYTQAPVTCNVSLNDGQQFIVYQNGNEFTRRTASLEFNLSTPGTWKISIVNSDGSELNSLIFTIADTIYQGFTINEQAEYLNLKVSKRITSLPITYSELEHATAYHLTQSGIYLIEIDALESLPFTLTNSQNINGKTCYAQTINSNSFEINITKSFFSFAFTTGQNGDRIAEDVVISSVDGVQLQKLEVYRNNKLVKEFSASELQKWEEIIETSRTFGENGRYTFRMTDKFGNTYETQIEKYYKVNVALVLLIAIIIAFIAIMIVVIIKTRHKVNVK